MALNKLGKVESKECLKFFTIINFNSFRIIYMVGNWNNRQNLWAFWNLRIFGFLVWELYVFHSFIFLKCFLIIYFHTTFQDPDASFDVNSHDKDPQPHYDYTNENRWQFKVRSEQSASSCPQNAKVQLIFSWIEVEIIISPYISHKWKCQFNHGWQDSNIKVRKDTCLWCLPPW